MKERNRRIVNSGLNPNSPISDISLTNSHKDDIRTPNEFTLTLKKLPEIILKNCAAKIKFLIKKTGKKRYNSKSINLISKKKKYKLNQQ